MTIFMFLVFANKRRGLDGFAYDSYPSVHPRARDQDFSVPYLLGTDYLVTSTVAYFDNIGHCGDFPLFSLYLIGQLLANIIQHFGW